MDWSFILIAGGISIAWIGLIVFYMRVVTRQKELVQELKELDRMIGLQPTDDENTV